MPASPELRAQLKAAADAAAEQLAQQGLPGRVSVRRERRPFGFNDGVLLPPEEFPAGVSAQAVKRAALGRPPLRGPVRVLVVLAEFPDKALPEGSRERFEELFFSTGSLPTGSVTEFLMGADTPEHDPRPRGGTFSISLSGDDEAELRGYWKALSDGGTTLEPLERAPWGDSFGMCVDRFGVSWMVNISGAQPSA